MMRSTVLLLLIVIQGLPAQGQFGISDSLLNKIEIIDFGIFIDDSGELGLEDAMDQPFDAGEADFLSAMSKLNRQRNLWVRFRIVASSEINDKFSVYAYRYSESRRYVFYNNHIDSADVGAHAIRNNAEENRASLPATLGLAQGDTVMVALRIKHYSRAMQTSMLRISISTQAELKVLDNSPPYVGLVEFYFYAFFCGLLFFQILYILLQWYLVRKIEYFYYTLYAIAVLGYFYNRFSAFYIIHPKLAFVSAETAYLFNDFLLILPTFFYLRFARYFTDLKLYDPKLSFHFKIFEVYMLGLAFAAMLLYLLPNDIDKNLLVLLLIVTHTPFSIYALIRIARQRRTVATFFVSGSACITIAHIVALLQPYTLPSLNGVIEPLIVTMLGLTLEIVIFNSGLLFKAKEAEVSKINIQNAYIAELKNSQKIQQEYAHVRDNLARDLHDDIGSSLSSISIFGYAAQQKLTAGDAGQTSHLLENIEKSATAALNAMSDLVWATYPENDSNHKLLERINAFAYEILSASNCLFVTEINPEFYDLSLNQIQRKNVLLILKEAINNAAKYSQATEVRMRIDAAANGILVISISDNGIGIKTAKAKGNGTRTMQNRAIELSDYFEIKTGDSGTTVLFGIQ